MNYLDKINKMVLEEYKSGDIDKRMFLQTLKAALIKRKIDLKEKYNDQEEISTLKNEYKQLKESAKEQEEAGRNELLDQTKKRIKILEQILPERIDEKALEEKIACIINTSENKDFPSIMKLAMGQLRASADGSDIARIVKKQLQTNE